MGSKSGPGAAGGPWERAAGCAAADHGRAEEAGERLGTAGILTHRSDRLDQSSGYGEASRRLRYGMLVRVDYRPLTGVSSSCH